MIKLLNNLNFKREVNAMPELVKLNHASAGSFWAGVEHEITDAKFGLYDFINGQGQKVGDSRWGLILFTKTGDSDPFSRVYTYGDEKAFVPNKAGTGLEIHGNMDELSDSCNCWKFLDSLIQGGFPEVDLLTDITVIVGTHFIGKVQANPNKYKADAVLNLVDKVISLPGESGKAGKATPSASDGIAKEAENVILKVVSAAGGTLNKNELLSPLTKELKGNKNRREIIQLASDDAFVASCESLTVDDAVISI